MRLERWFSVLNHLTLGLACVCLAEAEWSYLPIIPWIALAALGLIVFAAQVEGKHSLTTAGANGLGVGIAIISMWWIADIRFRGTATQSLFLLTSILPILGPLLIALMLVKMFRPRGPRDFWLLQGLGLLQVCIGCVFSSSLMFGILVGIYFFAGLGCLALHQLLAQLGPREARASIMPFRGFLAPFLIRWGAALALLSFLGFLVLPRGRWQAWNPEAHFGGNHKSPGSQATVGFEPNINLNRAGSVEATYEWAFKVRPLFPDGTPKGSLPVKLFRGIVLERYQRGVWTTWQRTPSRDSGNEKVQTELPELGLGQFTLEFEVEPNRARGLFLADPINLGSDADHPLPVISNNKGEKLFFRGLGTAFPTPNLLGAEVYKYQQRVAISDLPSIAPVMDLEDLSPASGTRFPSGGKEYIKALKERPDRDIEARAQQIMDELVKEPVNKGYPEDANPIVGDELVPANAKRVAPMLKEFLRAGHGFSYSLDLERDDTKIDPVLDFLNNVKQGHCERYAAALTLLLRARGIPARIVKGYRGADPQGDGTYIVRQRYAHSWVEAIVPSGEPKGGYVWMTLDPTPDEMAPSAQDNSARIAKGKDLWHNLIVDYNGETQAHLVAGLTGSGGLVGWIHLGAWVTLLVGLAGLGGNVPKWLMALLRRRAAEAERQSAIACYARLVKVLEKKGLKRAAGQTPLEWAEQAKRWLLEHCREPALFADLPEEVVHYFYLHRYGEGVRDAAYEKELEQRVRHLAVR